MSKASELRVLRYGRSVDAPINYHHRTGDSEGSGGTMLDFYAQTESAEEYYLEGEDELAKAKFLKGFQGYLRKVFSKQEREFLRRLMGGKEKPHEVGRAMGVDWFKYMHDIQRRAYKNIKPLIKLSELTGWTRAEEFTAALLKRLSLLEDGADVVDILPEAKNRAKIRAAMKAEREHAKEEKNNSYRIYCALHPEKIKAKDKRYYQAHREKIIAQKIAYQKANREKVLAQKREHYQAHKQEMRAKTAAYEKANREKIRETKRLYREANREKLREYQREWARKYNAANREKVRERKRAYKARKKAEREAAKLAALEAGNV